MRAPLGWRTPEQEVCPPCGCLGRVRCLIHIEFIHFHGMGVAQDALGNSFSGTVALLQLPIASRKAKRQALWQMLQLHGKRGCGHQGNPNAMPLPDLDPER